jgi:HTH-type transcriptional regulator/antitoxin HigA
MKIVKLIETDAEYEAALARIDALFDAPKNTPEGQELELLVVLVNHYEAIHYPIPAADPVEAIKYRMEELGWTAKDLEALLGDKATVSRILNRKRELTVEMMRKLSTHLRIPAAILLQPGPVTA